MNHNDSPQRHAVPTGNLPAWFCLRTQVKHERLAAARLRSMEGVEVLFPRMRFRRKWRKSVKYFIEPLFPNYLFARFNPQQALARVRHSYGVQNVVHFGSWLPVIPDEVIADIRKSLNPEQICQVKTILTAGDTVAICQGAFSGLPAVVKHYLPRKQRIQLLLEFLGHRVSIEIGAGEVIKDCVHPMIGLG